jgi:hypothetical protein
MNKQQPNMDRRRMLGRGVIVLTSMAAASLVSVSRHAMARSSPKNDFHYQDSPNDGRRCSDCTAYVSEGSRCKVFQEPVSPNGWCIAFSKRG